MSKFLKYLEPPAPFTGQTSFKHTVKNKNKLNDWLLEQEPNTLHRPLRKKFVREKVILNGIDDLWQADLVDVSNISKENKEYKFLLTVIDVFSKFAWVKPLKNKTSESILQALTEIFKSRKPDKLQTDKGREFLNKPVQDFLKKINVHLYTTYSELKASVVKRFNRTLKEKMWRYFTYKNNHDYTKILDNLVDSYNNKFHRTIKTTHSNVSSKNEEKVIKNIYGYDKNTGDDSLLTLNFKIGDKVRISKTKGLFEKGYTPNWTREIFVIDKIVYSNPLTYIIKDLNDETIEGRFYEQELQKINKNEEIYQIDKIIRKRKKNNKLEYFVSWIGYPKSFNSWVKKEDVMPSNSSMDLYPQNTMTDFTVLLKEPIRL
ncbi:unnamed protein product, partial [Brachionus calyciflorus]